MSRSPVNSGRVLLALLLVACAPVRDARADVGDAVKADAKDLFKDGVHFVLHVLGFERDTAVVSHAISLSPREAAVEFDLADGTTRTVAFRSGQVLVDGRAVGHYTSGGTLERAWRQLLAEAGPNETRAVLSRLRAFRASGLSGDERSAEDQIARTFRNLTVQEPPTGAGAGASVPAAAAAAAAQAALAGAIAESLAQHLTLGDIATIDSLTTQLAGLPDIGPDVVTSVRTSPLHIGSFTVPADEKIENSLVVFRGNADVYGTVEGNVVALLGDVICHDGATIEGSAVSVGGRVVGAGGEIHGDIKTLSALGRSYAAQVRKVERRSALDNLFQDVSTVVAVFIALAMVGFGTVFFGRRHVEIIADTASHSFGRSFVVGLLAQLLLLPAFAMMIVGLVLTIVGILVLPFAILAYVLGAALAVLGGYLAVAHAVGETFTRRRMANGAFVRSPNSYGYIFTGLVGLLGLWAAAALFGWLGPVVILLKAAAVIATWLAATTGFGAVLLSRAGLRETFAGRYSGEQTDEYLWATPPATPTPGRMGRQP